MKVTSLATPALLVDLDCLEGNLRRMAGYFLDKPAKLRPHFKNHQVLSLAVQQVQAGAIGITCARLEHAEALVHRGIRDIMIANEITGESPIKRFVEVSRIAPVMVAVDNPRVVSDMARLAGHRAQDLNVIVDLDVGLRRCGVSPGEAALSLAKMVLEKGLRFRGLMGYAGTVRLPPGPEKERFVHAALQPLLDTKMLMEREGIPVEIVSCGGTGDYSIAGAFPGVTEIQAGSYLLMDTRYAPFAPDFSPALTVLATVISKTMAERIVVDAGIKALSGEKELPSIKGYPGLRLRALHAEHALIDLLDPSVPVEVGDKIEIWVPYLDPTIQLHDRMWGVKNGEVKQVLKIEHSGKD